MKRALLTNISSFNPLWSGWAGSEELLELEGMQRSPNSEETEEKQDWKAQLRNLTDDHAVHTFCLLPIPFLLT